MKQKPISKFGSNNDKNRELKHQPRKRFGQNFLQNPHIISQILSALNALPQDKIIEIGPGLGAITEPLLRRLDKLIAIEVDTDLLAHLKNLNNGHKLELISADALTIDFSQWGEGLRVVGNLPYNISTPIIFCLLNYVSSIKDMHFMLQKEVVERLASKPNSKAYGRLSVMVQYFCEVIDLFDVPPESFFPAPKVNSAVVRLTPYKKSPFESVNMQVFAKVVAQAFSMRRKTLANNLKPLLDKQALESLGIDPILRPEQISVADYVKITNSL
ncbi:MAG: 16S rRNA (adenine(1518)-N(6)/adenine(1519)-N(6))-dimethyltransferase RsmA [Proteobacteria bacterium]|nr:16S rRNA (adenine(1518)-N(6)/adenine(1519)-N(6))-dimethyltransferase RsmA [Pseudomonadota bacterium]